MYQYLFSQKDDGNLAEEKYLEDFCKKKHLDSRSLIRMEQVHGAQIQQVTESDRGKNFQGVDCLLVCGKDIATCVSLVVKVADCIPLVFIDETQAMYALAHVGWKGTLSGLPGTVLEYMVRLGSQAKNIHINIGPHIQNCCYSIDLERVFLFRKKWKGKGIIQRNGVFYLDLAEIIAVDLLTAGIEKMNLTRESICTSCRSNSYFSYRARRKSTQEIEVGRQVGILTVFGVQ